LIEFNDFIFNFLKNKVERLNYEIKKFKHINWKSNIDIAESYYTEMKIYLFRYLFINYQTPDDIQYGSDDYERVLRYDKTCLLSVLEANIIGFKRTYKSSYDDEELYGGKVFGIKYHLKYDIHHETSKNKFCELCRRNFKSNCALIRHNKSKKHKFERNIFKIMINEIPSDLKGLICEYLLI